MQLLLLSVIFLSWAFSCMAAPSEGERSTGFHLISKVSLVKRQSSTTPSQCTSTCDPVYSVQSLNSPPSTYCTQSFETAYYNCFVCVGTADNATSADYAAAQQEFDNYYLTCANAGYSLPELTLPGQNPNRILTTSFLSIASQTTLTNTSPTSSASQTTITVPPSQSTVAPSLSQSTVFPPSASGSTSSASSSPAPTTNSGAKILSPNGIWAGLAITLGWITLTMQ